MSKYIISGGPGTGKTTLLHALKQHGYACQEEVSRRLIKELVTSGSECLLLNNWPTHQLQAGR